MKARGFDAGLWTLFGFVALIASPFYAFAQTTTPSTEDRVRTYFTDVPVMIAIAKCESGFREFNDDGSVLHGGAGDSMTGIFQIDPDIHAQKALSMGYDLNTVDGNMGYARYLYGAEGTTPWISSFPCWGQIASSSPSNTSTDSPNANTPLTIDLSLGMIDQQVNTLQQYLNMTGFSVASEGPGSPGNETTKFGALTLAAVKKFQCAKNITCSGDVYTTGYGFVNGRTRDALNAAVTRNTAADEGTSTPSVTADPPDESAQIKQLEDQIAALTAVLFQLQKQHGLIAQY